jgi:hypothetical protein
MKHRQARHVHRPTLRNDPSSVGAPCAAHFMPLLAGFIALTNECCYRHLAPNGAFPLRRLRFSSELHRLKIFAFIICVLFLVGAQPGAQAQNVDVNRAQLTQSQAPSPFGPGVSPEGTTVVPGPYDTELGEQAVLKRVERYEPWTATIASPVFYTTNVALTDRNEKHDIISAPVAAVSYQPHIIDTLYGFAGVRQQFFYYNHFNDFDFGSLDVEAGLIYFLPQFHNLVVRGEYDFNRLTFSDRVLDEFFTNHGLIFNA